MPWFLLPISSWANTTHHCACTALLVIQYLWLRVLGLWIMKLLMRGSHVAVVAISTALLPVQGGHSRVGSVGSWLQAGRVGHALECVRGCGQGETLEALQAGRVGQVCPGLRRGRDAEAGVSTGVRRAWLVRLEQKGSGE